VLLNHQASTASVVVAFLEFNMETLTVTSVEAAHWKNISTVSQHECSFTSNTPIPAVPLTIDALVRQCSKEAPNLELVSYPSSGINYANYTARQLDIFAFRVAQKYAAFMPPRASSSQVASVIGLLGPSNFDYLITILALTKLGHTVLFLSTRISPAAYESLLKTTGTAHLLIDESFKNLAETLSPGLPKLNIEVIAKSRTYEVTVETAESDTCLTHQLDPEAEKNQLAWIIHSSGSTGLPKPIFQTQGAALGNYRNNMNMKGFVTLPLYHAHGLSSLFRSIQSRKSIHLYNASLPLTHDYLLRTLEQNDFEIFYGVPYALKILAESSEGLEALAKMKVVMFGGSACPDSLGNRLVENNVNLVSHYGT
jgi:acyl-CoA synthetase (AMP-forming)/AMP-acid ligase II